MSFVIYCIWFSIPTLIVLLALWDWIDNRSRKKKDNHFIFLLWQAFFVSAIIFVCIIIDQFILDWVVSLPLIENIGRAVLLVLLLPLALLISATLMGPSQVMLIDKVTTQNRKKQ